MEIISLYIEKDIIIVQSFYHVSWTRHLRLATRNI